MAKKVNFTPELLAKIKNDYINGKSLLTIASEIRSSEKTISTKLKEMGIEIKNKRYLSKEILKVVKNRLKHESLTKICKDLHLGSYNVSLKLKEMGVTIINHQNKTKFDEHIFDVIDTEEKAYWLGFLYADGYVDSSPLKLNQKHYYSFGIGLQIKDVNHLIKFNKFTKHNKQNIYFYTKDPVRPSCVWRVRNRYLWTQLCALGVTPQKSLTLKFPDKSIFKSEDLIRHFIRGYFDGDGCISYYRHENRNIGIYFKPQLSIIGTKIFLDELLKIIKIPARYSHDKRHPNEIWSIFFNLKESRDLLHYLYDNSNIYLDRKYNLYKLFIKTECCSLKEFNEVLLRNIGEDCDVNPEINSEITKGSESSYSVGIE